jgi:P4 family phage/plasmid primase-like protien
VRSYRTATSKPVLFAETADYVQKLLPAQRLGATLCQQHCGVARTSNSKAAGGFDPAGAPNGGGGLLTAAFDFLEFERRWVCWRNENRSGRITKVPHSPSGGPAKADDPKTWNTKAAAEIRVPHLVNGEDGGIGIELGDLGDGTSLGGVDLDTCRTPDSTFEPWAAEIIRKFASYTEISPSGTGAKIFFLYRSADLPALRAAMGGPQHGREFKRSNGKDHPPAIELHISNRYFTVTEEGVAGTPDEIVTVTTELLLWLLLEAGPAFAGTSSKPQGADKSRSATAFRKGRAAVRAGASFEEMVEALRADPETADWVQDKGEANNRRELWRIYNKAAADGTAPRFSEEALALQLAAEHVDQLRYTAAWSRWFLWKDTHWAADETLTAFDLARELCRSTGADPKAAKIARAIASAKTVAAVAGLARSDRRIATHHNDWDADIWRLGGAATVDLRTGLTREARPEDLCTKVVAVAPNRGDCPLWRGFLDRVMAGDVELQRYLQRVAGYCLSGSNREHVMFFLYGTGANGKSVFTSTLRAIWHDYATVAPMEAFVETYTDRHPTELALMRAARLVVAQETERGRHWAESKIKALTGGDPIVARYMRQDFFEYVPQFKLVIAGNHKPGLRGVDEAIRRRMHLIPFTMTIPLAERDQHLFEKLKAEWGAILQWAIDGCLEWQRIGLAPPPAVIAATDKYLHDEDALGQWIEERCSIDRIYSASATDLYEDWKVWSEAAGERPGSQRRFSQSLEARGFDKRHERTGAMFFGIALRP